jgi:hypothetical protein
LLESFLKKLKAENGGKYDAIMVPGDLVAHGVPLDPTDPSKGNYELLKETQAAIASKFA